MIEIKGKCVVKGRAEGTALVADTTLSFWGEVDAVTGKVISVPASSENISGRTGEPKGPPSCPPRGDLGRSSGLTTERRSMSSVSNN